MKQIGSLFIMLFCTIVFMSCGKQCKREKTAAMDTMEEPYEVMCRTVVIQPFGKFPEYLAESLHEQIKEINPNAILEKKIVLPSTAYSNTFDGYRADLLLDVLRKTRDGKKYIVLGVTDQDLTRLREDGLEQPTMGLAAISGHVCVVSTYQLSKNFVDDQLYRLSMHEVGHTEGLGHCGKYRNCYMYRGLRRTNLWGTFDFCPSCKLHMVMKGWEM